MRCLVTGARVVQIPSCWSGLTLLHPPSSCRVHSSTLCCEIINNSLYLCHALSMSSGSNLSFPLVKFSHATDAASARSFSWRKETNGVRLLFSDYGTSNYYGPNCSTLIVLQGDNVLVWMTPEDLLGSFYPRRLRTEPQSIDRNASTCSPRFVNQTAS